MRGCRGSAPFCPCRLLNLSPISGRLVCRSRILMRKASSALDEIMTFSMYESVEPLYLVRKRRSDGVRPGCARRWAGGQVGAAAAE